MSLFGDWLIQEMHTNPDEHDDVDCSRNLLAKMRDERLRAGGPHLQATEGDEIKLYLAAIIRLLIKKGVITTDEIKAVVASLDELDGKRDNRLDGDLKQIVDRRD